MSNLLKQPLTIWCNFAFPDAVMQYLARETAGHRLVLSSQMHKSNLAAGDFDPDLPHADIALGQPHPKQLIELTRVKWTHLTSAGYTRYDTAEVRTALKNHGGQLTNSSGVYEEPCAEHLLAMIMALARRLPQIGQEQQADRPWHQHEHRAVSRLLTGQTALLYGYGAIARRLTELLAPLKMNLIGVRRQPRGDEPIRTITSEQADTMLSQADHVINILPAAAGTDNFFDAARFSRMKPGAIFYNIGRGSTADQPALLSALQSGKLSAAYLDVTDPEPLPPEHRLWSAPNCYITPHTAGGHTTEFERLAEHFVENLRRFEKGDALRDRVV